MQTLPLNQIALEEAIAFMRSLPPGSVDLLLTDPPYATTDLPWDKPIDWAVFWAEAKRVCRPLALRVMFAAQPFTTELINSNRRQFRYHLIWQKTMATGFLDANRRPLRGHEEILIFSEKFRGSTYNPQKTPGKPYTSRPEKKKNAHYSSRRKVTSINQGDRHPTSVLQFSKGNHKSLHPTQKPIELMHWLVRSYSNPGDVVLDPFMGSGSTAIACLENSRSFLGSELDPGYHAIAINRINEACQSRSTP